MDRSRLEAFSDGVFAVAITLLALNLAVPGPGHGALLQQLGSHWPAFVAYVISFFTIGIIWVNHHALVRNIAVVDRTLLFLNLLLLAFVVAIPFGHGHDGRLSHRRRPERRGGDGAVRGDLRRDVARLHGDLRVDVARGRADPPEGAGSRRGGRRADGSTSANSPTWSRSAWLSSARRCRWPSSASSMSITSSSARRPGKARPRKPALPLRADPRINRAIDPLSLC